MKKYLFIILAIGFLAACSDEAFDVGSEQASALQAVLNANEDWPYEVTGVLEIVEAGGYADSEYPDWAVGNLVTRGDDTGVSVDIGEGVASSAEINIDSGKEVRVWLEAPTKEHGIKTYAISRIESN